jgi:hypothetical protein
MISDQYKCIFIHIPKTAGTSNEKKLGHFQELKRGVQDHRAISEIEPITLSDLAHSCRTGNLFLLRRQIKKAILDSKKNFSRAYSSYFKFCFVRNPWARVFSWYKNVMRDEVHRKRFNVSETCSLKEFLERHLDQFELNSQLYWILDKKKNLAMDFIGRYERLSYDFRYVAGRLRIPDPTLPKLIAGDGDHYAMHYDQQMKDIIARHYRDEIRVFKFQFGE